MGDRKREVFFEEKKLLFAVKEAFSDDEEQLKQKDWNGEYIDVVDDSFLTDRFVLKMVVVVASGK